MTAFDDRERQEEAKFRHELELRFKIRNRRNKLFGLWIAEKLGLDQETALAYAREVVLADFERPGDDDIFEKVKTDLSEKPVDLSDHLLQKHLGELEDKAREQIMEE